MMTLTVTEPQEFSDEYCLKDENLNIIATAGSLTHAKEIARAVNCHNELIDVLQKLIEVNELDGEESVSTEDWKYLLKKAKGQL